MRAKKAKADRSPSGPKAASKRSKPDPSATPQVHSEEDASRRPELKARPIGSRRKAGPAKPGVRGGTLFQGQSATEGGASTTAESAPERTAPVKRVVLPAQEGGEARYPFATYRPAPPDEKAEVEELAAVTGAKPAREVSTGFVLGIALIVVALLSGIFIVRLGKRVNSLEKRVSRLDSAEMRTADAALPLP